MGLINVVKALLPLSNINETNPMGKSALYVAIENNQIPIVDLLLH